MPSANNSVSFEKIISVAWGANRWIPERFIPTPQVSILTNKVSRKMRVPVCIRVTPGEWIDVLVNDPAYTQGMQALLYRFSQKGEMMSRIEIRPPLVNFSEWRILDFVVDETGYIYLLQILRDDSGQHNHLCKLTPKGVLIWERSGRFTTGRLNLNKLEGNFRQLLIDADSIVYLSATQHRGLVAQIDLKKGTFKPYADWGEWTGEVYMDGQGRIYYVRYLPETGKRGWVYYNPFTQEESVTLCDNELYGLMAMPIGVDAQGQGYAVRGMSIGCIATDGLQLWLEQIDNIIMEEEKGAIYTSTFHVLDDNGELHIRQWENSGKFKKDIKLVLPSYLLAEFRGSWRLIYLDSEGKYYVYGGETPTRDGTLIVYSSDGIIENQITPAPDIHLIEYRLQAANTWSVDLEGNIYLPLLGPTSFHIIKLMYICNEKHEDYSKQS